MGQTLNNALGISYDASKNLNVQGKIALPDGSQITSVPKVTSIVPDDNTYTMLGAYAVDTSGGYVTINGSGFQNGATVIVGSLQALAVTYVSPTQLNAQVPSQSAGTYTVYVVNPDSSVAIRVNGLQYSSLPVWTGSQSPSGDASAVSIQLTATSDSTVTYALQNGSSLPSGLTLSSSGLLSGSVNSISSTTTYNFTVVATDSELQKTPRTISLTLSVGEPYFKYTSLLIHGDGANGATNNTFLDSSSNNLSINRTGTSTQGSFSPFSQTGWSNYFNGSNPDYMALPTSAATAFGGFNGNYTTIEFWVYQTTSSTSNTNEVFGSSTAVAANGRFYIEVGNESASAGATSKVLFYWTTSTGTADSVTTTAVVPVNQWAHVAIVVNATGSAGSHTVNIYVNGTGQSFTGRDFSSQTVTYDRLRIGGNSASYMNGWISNLRVVRAATNRVGYTGSTITVPTTALTAITNTVLLACQSNRFVDNSTNGFPLTSTGTPSVQPFSPFAPSSTYDTSSVGGSMFTGTSGTLGIGSGSITVSSTSAIGLGTGPFTIEFWIYQLSHVTGNYANYFGLNNYTNGINWSDRVNGVDPLYIGGTYYNWSPTTNVPLNQWTHMALVRNSSGVFRMFVNGKSVLTGTNSYDLGSSAPIAFADTPPGMNASGSPTSGYMSDMRITNTAVYDPTQSTCTVPTAPLTAISGTLFLCKATNAAIYDQTARNVFLTAASSSFVTQTSTAQAQFGTGSVQFNGSYLTAVPSTTSQSLNFGTGDYTIEMWVYVPASGGYQTLCTNRLSSATNNAFWFGLFTGTLTPAYLVGGGVVITASSSISANTWTHVALCRSSGTTKMFINGSQVGSASDPYTLTDSGCSFGASYNEGGYGLVGYMDEIRVTRGYARYTSNFTAPTSAFQNR
jgi:hypothetical protein